MTDGAVYGYALEAVKVLGGFVFAVSVVVLSCIWGAVMIGRAGS